MKMSESTRRQMTDKLASLTSKVSDDPLHDSGRHFVDGSYSNLTSCHHGDTGEYHNDADGEAIALLWNLWKGGALIELSAVSYAPAPSPKTLLVGWQPIDTAPKDGRHVLLYCDYYGVGRCAWESWRGVWRSDDPNHGIGFPQPTHWMPLPDYPKGSVRAENSRRAAIAANPEDQP